MPRYKIRLKAVLVAAAVLLILGALFSGSRAMAQEQAAVSTEETVIPEQEAAQTLADDLIGIPVYAAVPDDTSYAEVGSIDSLLFDDEEGIVGVVVSVGGFLGIGDKWVALAYEDIDLDTPDGIPRAAYVDLSREQIENAPSFKTLATKRAEQERERRIQEMQQQREIDQVQ